MGNTSGHRIETVAQLQALIGEPNPMTPKKLFSALDNGAIDFIGRSPFLVLATADAQGNEDASPKGDGPGFVAVEDARTLLIPERKGNRLMFSLRNILANPQVGIIFLVPGTDETFRVNGTATLSDDPVLLVRLKRPRRAGAAGDSSDGAGMLFPLRQGFHPLAALEAGVVARAPEDFLRENPDCANWRRRETCGASR
jgi:predicted pyridoxine 5'-phosphate oxidase superfamily flavin-nucleotide-binding protein